MRKTTGGQHDAATGKNALRTVLAADLDALDCRSVVDELIQLRLEQYRDTELLQAVIHPGDERVAHREAGAARVRQPVHQVTEEQLSRMEEISDGSKAAEQARSEEHTSELQSLMRISYAVFCLKKKKQNEKH